METTTAEQAAEAAKGLTFEVVWAALMENRQQMQEMQKESQKRSDESRIRILVGAVAGGSINDNVLEYAQKQGLYVIIQTGDSVAIADRPQGFKAREW